MGGQWVHGEEGNIAFKLGKENDLLMNSVVGEKLGEDEVWPYAYRESVCDVWDKYLSARCNCGVGVCC